MAGQQPERERWEEFVAEWNRLADACARSGSVILVEGEKDRRALVRLGLTSPIALVHQGQRLPALAQRLTDRYSRAVVLTDWDRKGGQLAERLTELLGGAGVAIDRDVRQRLARVLRGEVVHVEGLFRWATHLAESVGATVAALRDDGTG